MGLVLIRTVILYFMVLLTFRIMGKSELSEISPFQLVIIFMIAELAAIPIESPSVPLINGIAAIFALMFLQTLLSLLSIKSRTFRHLINGKPSILIEKGCINTGELRRLRISLSELLEQLRIKNISSLSDVEYAVMESNGELSVITKACKRPLTPQDLGMKKCESHLPLVLISDGVLCRDNLEALKITEKHITDCLCAHKLYAYKEVFLAFTDEKGLLHIYAYNEGKSASKEVAVCEIL